MTEHNAVKVALGLTQLQVAALEALAGPGWHEQARLAAEVGKSAASLCRSLYTLRGLGYVWEHVDPGARLWRRTDAGDTALDIRRKALGLEGSA